MHTLDDMLGVHSCADVTLRFGSENPEFRKEYCVRFRELSTTFIEELGVSSLNDLLDYQGNPEMGPKSEIEFRELLSWLTMQGVQHGWATRVSTRVM